MQCRICGSNKLSLFYLQGAKDQFKFYRCENCSLVNLDLSTISITDNQEKYSTDYSPPSDYDKDKNAATSFRFASKYVTVKGDYLDIGCGFGAMLYLFKKNGWNVNGLELSPVLANHVKEKLGVPVDVSDFLTYSSDRQFDLISLRHVLEHLPDANLALSRISEILKPKGFAHFEFPNIDSITHRFLRMRNKIPYMKKKYRESYVPGHCNEFSKQSFQYLIRTNGFKLIRWETYSKKSLPNLLYNHLHIGSKARAIVQKME